MEVGRIAAATGSSHSDQIANEGGDKKRHAGSAHHPGD